MHVNSIEYVCCLPSRYQQLNIDARWYIIILSDVHKWDWELQPYSFVYIIIFYRWRSTHEENKSIISGLAVSNLLTKCIYLAWIMNGHASKCLLLLKPILNYIQKSHSYVCLLKASLFRNYEFTRMMTTVELSGCIIFHFHIVLYIRYIWQIHGHRNNKVWRWYFG